MREGEVPIKRVRRIIKKRSKKNLKEEEDQEMASQSLFHDEEEEKDKVLSSRTNLRSISTDGEPKKKTEEGEGDGRRRRFVCGLVWEMAN